MSVSLPVIVDLMALFLREKETLTRKYILYSSCIHAKLSFLGWKIGHFTDLFHYQRRRLQSHSPNLPNFAMPLASQIQSQTPSLEDKERKNGFTRRQR